MTRKAVEFALAFIVITSAFAFIPSQSMAFTYVPDSMFRGNTTPFVDEGLTLLNVSWEQDTLGVRPDIGQSDFANHENLTLRVVDAGSPHGQVYQINQSGVKNDGYYGGRIYIGHVMQGNFTFAFDVYFNYSEAVTSTKAKCSICLETPGGTLPVFAQLIHQHSGHFDTLLTPSAVTIDQSFDTWYHFSAQVNLTSQMTYWFVDDVQVASGSLTNIPALSTIKFIMTTTSTATTRDIWFDNLQIIVPTHEIQAYPSSTPMKTGISFTFDDNCDSTYNNASVDLQGNNASVAIVTEWVGDPNKMSWAELQELADAGWEMMGHSLDHSVMTTLTASDQEYQFSKTKEYIEANMTDVEVLGWIYPGNAANNASHAIGWNYYEYLGGVSASQTFDLDRWSIMATSSQLWKLTQYLHCSIYGQHGFVDLYTHHIKGEAAPADSTNRSVFQYFVDRLIENGSRIVTPSQWFREVRNFCNVQVDGNGGGFATAYDLTYQNYTMNSSWFLVPDGRLYGEGVYLVNDSQTYGYLPTGTYEHHITVSGVNENITITVSQWNFELGTGTIAAWTANETATYTVYVSAGASCKVYQDGQVIALDYGPGFTFTAPNGGQFEVEMWYPASVSRLVVLTLDMLAMGVLVVIIAAATKPLKDSKNRTPDKVMKTLIQTAIYVIVALVLISMANNMFLGG